MSRARGQPPRVLLAEGRAGRGARLAAALAAGGRLQVEAVAASLMEAYDLTETRSPDAVAISTDMAVRAEFPMFCALLGAMRLRWCLYGPALPAGLAGTVVFVPLASAEDGAALADWLAGGAAARARPPAASSAPAVARSGRGAAGASPAPASAGAPGGAVPLVVIGASTGGIEALETVLAGWPADGPAVLVVQHIRGDFSGSVAARLDRICHACVAEAHNGAPLQRGRVYLAPGNDAHLEITGRHAPRCRLRPGPPVSGHRPSIDVLFHSAAVLVTAAESVAPPLAGVLLTGMGRDGAEGLLAIRRAGGLTVAQDRATSIVYGMPRVAAEIGAVDRPLPLARIGPAVLSALAVPAPATGPEPV